MFLKGNSAAQNDRAVLRRQQTPNPDRAEGSGHRQDGALLIPSNSDRDRVVVTPLREQKWLGLKASCEILKLEERQ